MSKIDKLWKKFQGSGIVTYSELVRLMSYYGFKEIKSKGSARKFENKDGLQFTIHEPHPENDLKAYQKKDARNFIKNFIESKK